MSDELVNLRWLDSEHASALSVGVCWGVPWHRGQLARDEQVVLLDENGELQAMQSWPIAYWPDGSVKWTAHAAQLMNVGSKQFHIKVTNMQQPQAATFVTEDDQVIAVNSDVLTCVIAKSGNVLIPSLSLKEDEAPNNNGEYARQDARRDSKVIAKNGRLKAIIRMPRPVAQSESVESQQEQQNCSSFEYMGVVEQAYVEMQGPLRAVIVIKGKHKLKQAKAAHNERSNQPSDTELIPFTVRLVFYRNQTTIELKHTMFYDGDPKHHQIAGIGICFDMPMQGELYNRHIRFAGDSGWFSEAAQGLMTHRLPAYIRGKYTAQLQGELVSWNDEHEGERKYKELTQDLAIWNDFKLMQLSPDSYKISKRTSSQAAWIRSLYGARARGLMYAGSENGGLAIGMKNFWQLCPSGMEVQGLGCEQAKLTLWLWSPDAEAMDLRHYDTVTHMLSSYEGAEELRSTPYGIAHTSDCMLHLSSQTPSLAQLEQLCRYNQYAPLLICEPERYAATSVFGRFSLPESKPSKEKTEGTLARGTAQSMQEQALEETIDSIWRFYKKEIEQRKWYGFWDYGDVMHSYDPVRHTWKYDIGGCAWQNTELVPNKWLWYSFLRTGEPELYYMAEAMTRHTSETDLYHFGPYQGLGSRHNVLHYGCGCKEARIGMATLHRFYYYLTCDERIGEIMDEVKDSDYTTVYLDPMRAYYPKDEHPTHTRSGPDWSAFCANWLVQWERYESKHYLNKIKAGIQSLKQCPDRLLAGPTFGYDPESGRLSYMGHENYDYHMMVCMGAPQVWIELADLLEDEQWADMVAELGEFYNLSPEEKSRRTQGAIPGRRWAIPMLSTLLMAYAAERKGNAALGKEAWGYLTNVTDHWQLSQLQPKQAPLLEYPYPVMEAEGLSTNTASQWSLNAIMCKAYIGELLN